LELKVDLGKNSYPIYIEKGNLKKLASLIKDNFKATKIAIISDENVYGIYGENIKSSLEEKGYSVKAVVLPPGEKTKAFEVLPGIFDELLDFKLTRSDLIIALGGGVIGDLAGFVASTFLRGVEFVQVPTSLLAQVDSSVGGKVAVDLAKGKNLIGSFYHPKMVVIDPEVLNTLSDRFFRDGLAEVIKYGCIKDKGLFEKLKNMKDTEELVKNIDSIIYTCCDIKRKIVEEDELDKGERMLLNFGHTLGHAVEQYYNYEKYSHGEGVAIGMYEIMKIAAKRGLADASVPEEIKAMLEKYSLPYTLAGENKEQLLEAIKLDKKFLNSTLNLILLKEIGESYIYKTKDDFFSEL